MISHLHWSPRLFLSAKFAAWFTYISSPLCATRMRSLLRLPEDFCARAAEEVQKCGVYVHQEPMVRLGKSWQCRAMLHQFLCHLSLAHLVASGYCHDMLSIDVHCIVIVTNRGTLRCPQWKGFRNLPGLGRPPGPLRLYPPAKATGAARFNEVK